MMRTHLITLVLAGLFTALPQAQAFDLNDALKGAQEAIDKNKQKDATPAAEPAKTEPAPAETANSTQAESKPAINLKKPSRAEEIAIGREITGNLLGASPLVKDDALQGYVNQVGRWVASQSERPDLPWHFGVIESEDLNAFAAPGGYVVITKGLYRKMQNEAQLAGVLGHEIAHVVKKHHLKVLQKQQLLNIGAGLLGEKYAKDNQTVEKVIGSGAEIMARGLDKDAEYEADRMGLVLATRAGYEPYGLPEVLQSISEASKEDKSVALLFKTHPHPDDRLTKLAESAGSRLDKITGKPLQTRFYKLKD